MKKIINFFVFCSGANQSILKRCPSDLNKMVAIGAVVLATALLASISGAYALYNVFEAIVPAILFGMLWSFFIFFIDRMIIMSIRKTTFLKDLLVSAPRIILALIISIVISKPLELRILDTKIQAKMFELKSDKISSLTKENQTFIESAYDKPIRNLKNEIAEKENTLPVIIQNLDKEIIEKTNEKEKKWVAIQALNAPLYRQINLLTEKATDNEYQDEINTLKRRIAANNTQINPWEKEISYLNSQRKNEYSSYLAELSSLKSRNNNEIQTITSEKNRKQEELKGRETEGTTVYDKAKLLPDKISALHMIKEEDPAINVLSFFIMLLFVSVELSPVFVKLFSPKGPYDEMLEAHEFAFKISNEEKKLRLEQLRTKRIALSKSIDEIAANAELEAQKKISEKAISTQVSVAEEILNKWKEKELKNVRKGLPDYITQN